MHRNIMFRCIIFPSFGECKFKSAPVGANVLAELEEKSRAAKWGAPERAEHCALFSIIGFSDVLREIAGRCRTCCCSSRRASIQSANRKRLLGSRLRSGLNTQPVRVMEEASGRLRTALFAYTLGSMPLTLRRNAKYDIDGTSNYSYQKRSLKHIAVW